MSTRSKVKGVDLPGNAHYVSVCEAWRGCFELIVVGDAGRVGEQVPDGH